MKKDQVAINNGIEIREAADIAKGKQYFVDGKKTGALITKDLSDSSQTQLYFMNGGKYKELYVSGIYKGIMFFDILDSNGKMSGYVDFEGKDIKEIYIDDIFNQKFDYQDLSDHDECPGFYTFRAMLRKYDNIGKGDSIHIECECESKSLGCFFNTDIVFDMNKKEERDLYWTVNKAARNATTIDAMKYMFRDVISYSDEDSRLNAVKFFDGNIIEKSNYITSIDAKIKEELIKCHIWTWRQKGRGSAQL